LLVLPDHTVGGLKFVFNILTPGVEPLSPLVGAVNKDSMLLLEGPPSSQFLQVLSGQADEVNAGANGIKLYFLVLRTEINGPCQFNLFSVAS